MAGSDQLIALTADIEGEGPDVQRQIGHLLALLENSGLKATLFFLGQLAEQVPHLVRRASAAGHEIGFHGYEHVFLRELSPARFKRELREHIPRLEDLAQDRVRGFRAPFFSVTRETSWSLDILAEFGLHYDASIYPAFNDRYGWLGAPCSPARVATTGLVIFPVPLLRWWLPIAFSGGAYLRLLPEFLVNWGFRNKRPSGPHMIYVHPWELFPSTARTKIPLRQRLTNSAGRKAMSHKLQRLFAQHRNRLKPMREVIASLPFIPEWSPHSSNSEART